MRLCQSKRCYILLALLPVPPKFATISATGKEVAEQQAHNREILRRCFECIFRPLDAIQEHGKAMVCADGRIRLCFPMICAWIADYFENVNLHSIQSGTCPVCEAPKSSFGSLSATSHQPRDYAEYFERLTEATDPGADNWQKKQAVSYLEEKGVRFNEGAFWTTKSVDGSMIASPDILHTVYLGILDHLMKWLIPFLKDHKRHALFDAIWSVVPAYPALLRFNKPYSAVSQWQGKEMRTLGRILLPVLSATLFNPSVGEKKRFHDAIRCVKGIIYFHLMAQYRSHTDATLQYMNDYLADFHRHKEVFLQYRAGKITKRAAASSGAAFAAQLKEARESEPGWTRLSVTAKNRQIDRDKALAAMQMEAALKDDSSFNFVKMHLLTHFTSHVKELGHLSNVSSELPETLHRELKDAFRRSNKVNADFQILQTMARVSSFDYRELNVQVAAERSDGQSHLPVPLPRRLKNPHTDLNDLSELARWCAIPQEDFQNLVAWCQKHWFGRAQYFDDEDAFRRLSDCVYTRYNSVSIPITTFQSEAEQQIHVIRCTGLEAWRNQNAPRNDHVLLWTNDTSGSQFATSQGRIPARVDCLFSLKDEGEGGEGENGKGEGGTVISCMALVTTLVPGPIRQPEGMMLVEQRDQAPWQERHRQIPLTGVGATYIVPLRAIQCAAHLIPLDPSAANRRWYLSNTVDLEAFNLLY